MHHARLASLVVLAALAQPVSAAVFCVNNATDLATALNNAGTNGTDDQIRIRIGTYERDNGNTAFSYATSVAQTLLITGGWFPLLGNPCAARVPDPTLTVISGSNVRQGMRIQVNNGAAGTVEIENLTFADANNPVEVGGGLELQASLAPANFRVERVLFRNNRTEDWGGGLSVTTQGTVLVRNNVFVANEGGTSNGSAVFLQVLDTTPQEIRVTLGNNTIVANTCASGQPNCSAFWQFGSARYLVYNNAFAFNEGIDANFNGTTGELFCNNIGQFTGTPDFVSGCNLNLADPQFQNPLGGDFNLRFESPLRNAGTGAYILGTTDFDGKPRVNDGQVDIGAFENDNLLFKSGFETLQ